ncbi:hypothetical protein [Picrophilus oshimae]|uniref:Uncharacterized membrane protein n=1 Tax=Picrophilus torridus (strain ATCC 700027 / DSM 9790 / JCM 10055 / NBRC 100828 / KAW 2/3) TaxID=1122961 RepID=A0A8G2FWQ0_PICTO|nr:hypothetical protein [Picrophilus oshimae]SMD30828.1 Uncharacterized membrane protein [Picrophilus oshimae DSM 9789]
MEDSITAREGYLILFYIFATIIYELWYLTAYLYWWLSSIVIPSLMIILSVFIVLRISRSNYNIKHDLLNYIPVFAVIFSAFEYPMYEFSYINVIISVLAASFLLLIYFIVRSDYKYLFIILFIFSFNVFMFLHAVSPYGTDEISFDYYSTLKILDGINPYKLIITNSVLQRLGINPQFYTPLLTGGHVENLSYPALAFLIFIPAVLLKFVPGIIIAVFAFFTLVMLFVFYKNRPKSYFFVAALITINPVYFLYSISGITGYVWLLLLSVSFYTFSKNNIKLSGAFYGLSLAAKQLPVYIAIPYLYIVYKRSGIKGSLYFVIFSIIGFLPENIYFIYVSPLKYISDIISPISEPLIGIGFGFSQVSFLNVFYIAPAYFSYISIVTMILLSFLFILYYPDSYYWLFMIPVIVLQLNYRALFNYIIFWPILCLMLINTEPVIEGAKKLNKSNVLKLIRARYAKIFLTLFIVIIIVAGLGMHSESKNDMRINIENEYIVNSNVSYIIVNVTGVNITPEFRAFFGPDMYTANGVIFNETVVYKNSKYEIINLTPAYNYYLPVSKNIEIVGYYNNIQASAHLIIS